MKRMNHRRVGLQETGMTDLVVRNALRKTSRARGLRCNAHDLSNAARPDLSHTRAMQKLGVQMGVAARLPDTFAVGLRNFAYTPIPARHLRPAPMTFALQALIT
jgi:hypothetical protein